jgi:protein ImuB
MKSQGRQTAVRQTAVGRTLRRALAAESKFTTADLFTPALAITPPIPAPSAAAPPTAAPLAAGPLATAPPVTRQLAPLHSPSKQLWYAVVFPELKEPQASGMLQRLCLSAQRFTSLVSIEEPNALLLEIKGSVKLFGSLETLHRAIDAAWQRLALSARSATAPTTLGALWLARADQQVRIEAPGLLAGVLADVPIGCTAWNPQWLMTLRSMGVTRLKELMRLPRAGLARRLSPAALVDLDIALARQAAPRRGFVPRERFRQRCDFEAEIETVGYLQKALEPLIDHCAQFLRERQAGVQSLELILRHRVIAVTRVRFGLASITSERRRLSDVLDEKLNRLELAAPVRGMELRSGPLLPLSADSLDAFVGLGGVGRDSAPQLVERLRARLGDDAVYGLRSIPEHRPEAAWQRVRELRLTDMPVTHARATSGQVRVAVQVADVGVADHEMPRPVWLLAEPTPLSAADVGQLQRGGWVLEAGPERIESGWWDGKGVARDYYVARRTRGARWWIFQERQTQAWYLHGVFA